MGYYGYALPLFTSPKAKSYLRFPSPKVRKYVRTAEGNLFFALPQRGITKGVQPKGYNQRGTTKGVQPKGYNQRGTTKGDRKAKLRSPVRTRTRAPKVHRGKAFTFVCVPLCFTPLFTLSLSIPQRGKEVDLPSVSLSP